jgi:hypothetical protein
MTWVFSFSLAIAFFCNLQCGPTLAAADNNHGDEPVFSSLFDNAATNDLDSGPKWTRHGGTRIADGIVGGALRLGKGEYWMLDASHLLHGDEGTITFWVRPHWGENEHDSHAFMSMPWEDGRGGYLVISRGWWEPKGSRLTYFVCNNQDFAHVSKEIRFEKDRWMYIACSWKAGGKGFVRLYVNGILAAEKRIAGRIGNLPTRRLVLGGDQGTPMGQNRWADSDFDNVAFFRKALTAQKILDNYEARQPFRAMVPSDAEGRMVETRAIFDEGTSWMTEDGARNTIQRIRRAGFNVYVPCIWHGAGARFPSKSIVAEGTLHFGDRDPLARLIYIAHEHGIKVHPWFTVALRQGDLLPEFHPPGTPLQSFDLHSLAFRQFIVNLIREVVEKYPVDGINLDFIRTMGICLSTQCVAEYYDKYGRNLLADAPLTDPYGVLKVASLQAWQDEAVEEIVRDVSSTVRRVRPLAQISVDGHPTPYASAEGREEIRWANLRLIDYIFDMAYGDDPDVETPNLMRPRLNDPNRLIILINDYSQDGARLYSKEPTWMMRIISYIRNRWGNGIGVYLYSMLSDEQIEAFSKGIFKTEAILP